MAGPDDCRLEIADWRFFDCRLTIEIADWRLTIGIDDWDWRFRAGIRAIRPKTLQCDLAFVQPDVLEHGERFRVRLAGHCERHDIGTGIDRGGDAAASAAKAAACTKRLGTEIPVHAVDALVLRPVERSNGFAGRVRDRDLHVAARGGLEVIADHRPALRVLADERFLTAGLLTTLPVGQIRDRRPDVEQHDVLGPDRR